ncbi:hypothetical protein DFQ01_12144 [Paenibacillus cellulosilyticus]|uniref:Uncharacterized protein n=1 Tax=Paenibacillus cellulosilyticus TaxID=375489 RepID=A0A2V2YNK9_9BACL|nr:hypothetical protein [Paenibacillus cellulosilyticus]PWV97401.1 hypothetical protein DFQ01_12144 [Paenibacillus cellulosilyticus]QKS48558.1 hypothetical protein HUB94_30455 [Paenibacillus cellulosilyticus]
MIWLQTIKHFEQRYGSQYVSIFDHLRSRLTESETGDGKFVVLPFEAGIGKSLQTDRIVGEYLRSELTRGQRHTVVRRNDDLRRFLIIKKFKDDVLGCAERINQVSSGEIALGITSENWSDYKANLESISDFLVVVITHERYLDLALDAYTRAFFTEGRHTLVIDEALFPPVCTLSATKIRAVQQVWPLMMQRSLVDAYEPFLHEIQRLSKSQEQIVVCDPLDCSESIKRFKEEADAQSFDMKTSNLISEFVNDLEVIIANTTLCIDGRLTSYDPRIVRWGLRNNIILDANGNFDMRYSFDDTVTVDNQAPVINHDNWTIHHIPYNSSKSSIRRTADYHSRLMELVLERKKPDDKTLIVTQKEFETKLQAALGNDDPDVQIAYFGNIIGKNDWRDFNQVWIVSNAIIPMEVYSLYWLMSTREEFQERSIDIVLHKRKKGKVSFKDQRFEDIRMGHLVGEIYQAVKRINRDNNHTAEIFIVNNDPDITEALERHMPGIRRGETIDLDVAQNMTSKETKETEADRLEAYLLSLPIGERVAKAVVCKEARNINANNFGRTLKDEKIQRLINAGIIEVKSRYITRIS